MSDGWIMLHRALCEWPHYRRSRAVHVWIDLLLHATHRDRPFVFDGRRVVLRPGQLVTSRTSIAARTGIPASCVDRVLKRMESEHQIGQQTGRASRLVTITNWSAYQKPDTKPDNERTASGPPADTNKNGRMEEENGREARTREESSPSQASGASSDNSTIAPELAARWAPAMKALRGTGKFPALRIEHLVRADRAHPGARLVEPEAFEEVADDARGMAGGIHDAAAWLRRRCSGIEARKLGRPGGGRPDDRTAARLAAATAGVGAEW